MAEWEIQQFRTYQQKATLLALIAEPILLLNYPILIVNIIRSRTPPYLPPGRPSFGTSANPGGPGSAPATCHIALSGVARTDNIVALEKMSGGSTTRETYLPVTAPGWRNTNHPNHRLTGP